ncbi:hypothetical protein JI666_00670 [Bacillus sp. NTK071]|uniref:hypothetical protein n=1 Tax=Bacillus sp. NTK071 TaxID=2802175 RepID=UPI001A8D9861|nr:hypothetical protein [Bacillus sp. NTK071]MBN8207253.1 hypothetical protein [Bacillus sp. NTK071]
MASKLFVLLRGYIGKTFSEMRFINSGEETVLMNATIINVGSDFVVVSQPGSGGDGEVTVPLRNLVAYYE